VSNELPGPIRDRVADFPETRVGVNTVTVTLRDGRVVGGVDVAWGSQVVRVRGQDSNPFEAEDVVEVDDESGLA